MAKATKKTATKKVADKIETPVERVTTVLRKGTLAYFGMYGAAYEAAQTRFTKARETTDEMFVDFVKKGEELETQAQDFFKGTQEKVSETYEENAKKVRSILPSAANDRVEELEAEIKALNKKIVAMGKQARTTVKTAKKTATETTTNAIKATTESVKEAAKDVKEAATKAA